MENLTLDFGEEFEPTLTLSDLLNQVKVAFDTFIAFKSFQVECEVQSVKNIRSFYYLDLIELDFSGKIKAKVKGNIFNPAVMNAFLRRTKLSDCSELENKKVMLTVRPNFHKDYGFSLNIEKIHEGHFVGEQEVMKAKILAKIEKEGILNFNKEKKVGYPDFKIAVITGEKSEGFRDFKEILEDSGYKFNLDLYTSLVNGNGASKEVLERLDEIENGDVDYDLVVIVRGGGGSEGMHWTNDEDLALKVANYKYPVMSAVGHTVDLSILDIVSCYSAKTPSEGAQKIIDIYTDFEDGLNEVYDNIIGTVEDFKSYYREELNRFSLVQERYNEIFKGYKIKLDNLKMGIDSVFNYKVKELRSGLDLLNNNIVSNSPEKILNKGYSLVLDGDKVTTDLIDDKTYSLKTKAGEFKIIKKD